MNAIFRRQGYTFIRFWDYWIPIVQKAFSFMALSVVIEFFWCSSSFSICLSLNYGEDCKHKKV